MAKDFNVLGAVRGSAMDNGGLTEEYEYFTIIINAIKVTVTQLSSLTL